MVLWYFWRYEAAVPFNIVGKSSVFVRCRVFWSAVSCLSIHVTYLPIFWRVGSRASDGNFDDLMMSIKSTEAMPQRNNIKYESRAKF